MSVKCLKGVKMFFSSAFWVSFSCHEINKIRRVAIIVNTFSVLQVSQLSRVSTIYLFLNCSWVSWLNRLTCYNIAILHLLTIVIIRAVIIQHYLYCFRCRLGTYTVRSWPWTYCVSCLILVGYCRNSISTNAMSCHEQSFIK